MASRALPQRLSLLAAGLGLLAPPARALGQAPAGSASPVAQPAASSSAPPAGPAAPAPALPGAEQPRAYTLRECLDLADHNHPNIFAARARVDYMRAQLDEAHTAPFMGFNLAAGVGPAPTFRGGPIYTQDSLVGLNSNIGLAWRAQIDGNIPLWTFGKITNTWRAAEAQIQVGEADEQKTRNSVRLDVRKAYYGLQLARDAAALLNEAASKLDAALRPMQKKVDEGEGDEIDLLRLQTARAELEARRADAEGGERTALAALRFYTGVKAGFDIPVLPLRPPRHPLEPLLTYLEAARTHRPDLKMAEAGLKARTALADLARSKRMPDLGIALYGSYSRAPEITQQFNPFVRNDTNYLLYGVAVGVRWSLDFLPATARVHQADAQLEEIRQTLRYALGGVATEVEKAYAEAVQAQKKVDAYKQASRYARQWMIKVGSGIDVGLMEERDLVDPARQYALQRYSYLSALLDLNMAMANLALATGWDIIAEPLE